MYFDFSSYLKNIKKCQDQIFLQWNIWTWWVWIWFFASKFFDTLLTLKRYTLILVQLNIYFLFHHQHLKSKEHDLSDNKYMLHHQSWDSIIVLCFRECLHIGHGLSRLKSTLKTFYDKLTGILTVLVILGLWFTFYLLSQWFLLPSAMLDRKHGNFL